MVSSGAKLIPLTCKLSCLSAAAVFFIRFLFVFSQLCSILYLPSQRLFPIFLFLLPKLLIIMILNPISAISSRLVSFCDIKSTVSMLFLVPGFTYRLSDFDQYLMRNRLYGIPTSNNRTFFLNISEQPYWIFLG